MYLLVSYICSNGIVQDCAIQQQVLEVIMVLWYGNKGNVASGKVVLGMVLR